MAKDQNRVAMLARTKMFGSLPSPLLEATADSMHEVRFAPGQLIFSRGDPGAGLYLVCDGRVRLSILTSEGRELSFAHAVEGDIFGEIAVLDGSSRSANATALGRTVLLSLPAPAFEQLLVQYPVLARAVIKFLCARLRDVSDHLEDIALVPIEARVARYFLDRIRIGSQDAAPRTSRLELGMSQNELAMLLGASRPKVNGALMILEETGAIRRNGMVFECDRDRLSDIARRD